MSARTSRSTMLRSDGQSNRAACPERSAVEAAHREVNACWVVQDDALRRASDTRRAPTRRRGQLTRVDAVPCAEYTRSWRAGSPSGGSAGTADSRQRAHESRGRSACTDRTGSSRARTSPFGAATTHYAAVYRRGSSVAAVFTCRPWKPAAWALVDLVLAPADDPAAQANGVREPPGLQALRPGAVATRLFASNAETTPP